MSEITNDKFLTDGALMLKKQNESLLNLLCKKSIRNKVKLSIFVDEIHFAYRSEEALQQDAMLVRDTILAVQVLNERLITDGVDIVIYCGVRSEYLDHPIISIADVNHAIESVGHNVTWSFYPHNKNHPIFEVMYKRFKKSIGDNFTHSQFFDIYMHQTDPAAFLSRTWSKPRDIIRYFKTAKELYRDRASLSASEQNAVWRSYSHAAWTELKTSASPFLSPEALALFEQIMRDITSEVVDGKRKMNVAEFS